MAAVIAWPVLSSAAWAGGTDDYGCSNANLRGSYAFTIEGQTLGIVGSPDQPLPAPIPVNGVAMTWFDGKGKLTQVDYVMKGGVKRPGNGADNGFDSGETGTTRFSRTAPAPSRSISPRRTIWSRGSSSPATA